MAVSMSAIPRVGPNGVYRPGGTVGVAPNTGANFGVTSYPYANLPNAGTTFGGGYGATYPHLPNAGYNFAPSYYGGGMNNGTIYGNQLNQGFRYGYVR